MERLNDRKGNLEKQKEKDRWNGEIKGKQMGENEGQIGLGGLSKCDDISNLYTVIALCWRWRETF